MKQVLLLLLWLCLALPPAAQAASLGIAAVVGEEAISSFDVDNRMKFILATTGLSPTQDVMERIRPQVVHSLIDEKLQLQAAAKNDVTIGDEEVTKAIAALETQRGMPSGSLLGMLDQKHVPKETFRQQVKAQLAWNRLIMKRIRPQVRISDQEVDLARQKFSSVGIKQELKIAPITLPIDKPEREADMRRLADKLTGELRAGASFEEVARQFSSSSASAGGKVEAFWIRSEQLDPILARALEGAKAGSITPPLRTAGGYTIVKVYETRALESQGEAKEVQVTLKEILLRLKPDAEQKEADVLLKIGEEVSKHPGTCQEKGIAGIANLQEFDIMVDFRQAFISELPPALKIIAENLKIGDISTPFASSEGIRLYMLCERKEGLAKSADRERVTNMLYVQKMELEAQKYLRDLRRQTFIEIR